MYYYVYYIVSYYLNKELITLVTLLHERIVKRTVFIATLESEFGAEVKLDYYY